jgi:hypothetical protein
LLVRAGGKSTHFYRNGALVPGVASPTRSEALAATVSGVTKKGLLPENHFFRMDCFAIVKKENTFAVRLLSYLGLYKILISLAVHMSVRMP